MRKRFTLANAGFLCKSLLWSLLLYGCTISVCNWHEISTMFGSKENAPVAYTSSPGDITSVKISLDSLQKRIHIADNVLQHLRTYLHY